jgi:hypothetical protein
VNKLDIYLKWLKENFREENSDSWTEWITPFLDKNNDHIQIYFRENQGKIIISDAGQTFSNLEMAGFPLSEKRVDILSTIFRGFNIDWDEDSNIEITCNDNNFPERFHALLQTIISVDGLAYLSKANVKNMFQEDVATLLKEHQITYHANQEYTGRSGLAVSFPFFVPQHKTYQETLIQLINQPKTNPKQFLFEWSDTEETRGKSQSIALINDINMKPPKSYIKALNEYGVQTILWSDKETLIDELAS